MEPGVPAAQSRRRLPMDAGLGRSEVRIGRQFRGLRRSRHRHHRTQERRRPIRESRAALEVQPSRDPAAGRPADRGRGRRAGADRAGSARRREPAVGRIVDRLERLKRRMDELNVSDELRTDLRALHERTTTLAQNVRHLSHDLHPTVLRHAGLVAALTSYCAEVERSHGTASKCSAEGELRVHRPGGRALPVSDRAGSAAQRCRARRRESGRCSIAPHRRRRRAYHRG